jgi:DNA-binding CsgD family transcriptional regulator
MAEKKKRQCTTTAKAMRLRYNTALTDRELQVAELLMEGYSNEGIENQLKITHGSVVQHIRSIFGRTGATSRLDFAVGRWRARCSGLETELANISQINEWKLRYEALMRDMQFLLSTSSRATINLNQQKGVHHETSSLPARLRPGGRLN